MIIGALFLGITIGMLCGWVTCALMVHSARESDALDAERRKCQHPNDCERTSEGYCARCHSELYP